MNGEIRFCGGGRAGKWPNPHIMTRSDRKRGEVNRGWPSGWGAEKGYGERESANQVPSGRSYKNADDRVGVRREKESERELFAFPLSPHPTDLDSR